MKCFVNILFPKIDRIGIFIKDYNQTANEWNFTWLIVRLLPSISPRRLRLVRILFSLKNVESSFKASRVSCGEEDQFIFEIKKGGKYYNLPYHFQFDYLEFWQVFLPADSLFLRLIPFFFRFRHGCFMNVKCDMCQNKNSSAICWHGGTIQFMDIMAISINY